MFKRTMLVRALQLAFASAAIGGGVIELNHI
jgi:hypothetical protein